MAGQALLCFDYEGHWGMPFNARYDLAAVTERLLAVLAANDARATFFVVGRIVEQEPELISAIARGGHEVALHGWRHERLDALGAAGLAAVDEGLARAEELVTEITGTRPTGFRAPYLLAPRFYEPGVYRMLADHGYKWVSNREVRYPEELFNPDRVGSQLPARALGRLDGVLCGRVGRALLVGLNPWVWRRDSVAGTRRESLAWLAGGRAPFRRGPLLEIPVYSPLDCDLVGFPAPDDETGDERLRYAETSLRIAARRPASHVMYTFHDWIVGGGDRLGMLDRLLGWLGRESLSVCSVADCWRELAAG